MSFHDHAYDAAYEAEKGEAIRRKHELAALGKAVSRELAALNAKVDRLLELRGGQVTQQPKVEKPMTISQFAERVGVTRRTVSQHIKNGEIARVCGLIPASELRRFGL